MNVKKNYWQKKLRDMMARLGDYIEIANNEKLLPGLRNDAKRAIPVLQARFVELQRRACEAPDA